MSQSNQRELGAINAVTNFFESPFEGIANALAHRKYEKLTRETLSQQKTAVLSSEVKCSLDGAPLPPAALQDLLSIPHISCRCEAWGTCVKEACPCNILCPDNFHLFKRPDMESVQDLTTPENSLAFRNYVDDGPVPGRIRSTDGICWGHASVTQKFNRLAFFKPDSQPPYRLTSQDPGERRKAIKFYHHIIDDIVNNKASDIPGYKNLYEFSADPEFSNYFHDKVTREWADRAMSWQGLTLALKDKPEPRAKNEKIFAEARQRLAMNQQSNLVFTVKDARFFTHSLLVSHETQMNGVNVLCIRDNNEEETSNAACENYMYLNENGEIIYVFLHSIYQVTVGGIGFAFNDERDAVNQVKSLHKRCNREKGCR
jgi:hypothetical protein